MALVSIPVIAAVVLLALGVYRLVLLPVYLSPLSKIPNAHWSASFSSVWILNERWNRRETLAVHEAHEKCGPIIRLAPNEISVNCVDGGIRTIYAGGYEKGDWYSNTFNNYDVEPMFSMARHAQHSKRKRMLSNIYAKSTLQASSALETISKTLLQTQLTPELQRRMHASESIEFYTVFSAITLDFVTAYVFGLETGTKFVLEPTLGKKFFHDFKTRQHFQFWVAEVPHVLQWLTAAGLKWLVIPRWVAKANKTLEDLILAKCERSESIVRRSEVDMEPPKPENWPTVYAQLRQALLKDVSARKLSPSSEEDLHEIDTIIQNNKYVIASEMVDQVLAGFDTSSITLTFLAWELSRPENSEWQARLRKEVRGLKNTHDAKEVDSLPTLHAILMETLRLHAAIPGNQPRITPANATLGPPGHIIANLPANVRVQAQAWSLHREPSVFPNPETWDPSRWLDVSSEQAREMARWFWAFGSGGRMCVGSNLAMLDMKAIVVAIWSEFRTVLVDGEGMVHASTYMAEPVGRNGKFCVLKLENP